MQQGFSDPPQGGAEHDPLAVARSQAPLLDPEPFVRSSTLCLTHAVSSDPRQAAKTYLEKHYESFPTASLDDLIKHGLKALQVRKCGQMCVGGRGGC